jgi:hypothetical protein
VPSDREIRWKRKGRRPSKTDVHTILLDFLGGAGTVEAGKDRFYVRLGGSWSHPLRRFPEFLTKAMHAVASKPDPRFLERIIEVWKDRSSLYVMTRQQDDFTNGVAERIVDVFTRAYEAERVPL